MGQDWIEVEIASKRRLATDIVALTLIDPARRPLPAFTAGSHVDLEIAGGMIRQYSLCNDPADSCAYEIAILRDPGSRGGSVAVHEGLAAGARVRISAPRNLFPLVPTAGKSLLLGGGIGVTPLLCMAEGLARTGAPLELHYCARSRDRAAFLDRIASSAYVAQVHLHFDDGDPSQHFDPASVFAKADARSHAHICGPNGFIDWIYHAAAAAGFSAERLHREYFAAAETLRKADSCSFEVEIASTGAVLEVPADRSVVAVLQEHGIEISVSCEQGVCGTCITRVLAGTPDHRDMLAIEGEGEFAPCCSRSRSPRLVLDL
jgi:vanillate monooxygenase ferredoxin subunit